VFCRPRFPLYIFFYYVSWLYIPTTLLLNNLKKSFVNQNIFLNSSLIGLLSATFYLPWDVVGAKFVWWTWHTTDNALKHRRLGVPCASTLWTVVFCCIWGFLYLFSSKTDKSLSTRQSIKSVAIIFTFSVPTMMIIMGFMTSLTGGITTPSLLVSTICILLLFVMVSKMLQTGGRSDDKMSAEIGTGMKSISWLYICVLVHYLYLIFTIYYFDPRSQISTGVHQTFGDCAVEGIDISGMKRSIYTCNKDTAMMHVFHSPDNCKVNHGQKDAIIKPSANNNTWYTLCGKEKSDEWVKEATLTCIGSCICFFFLLHIGNATSRINKNIINSSTGKKTN
jgi:hypothetical protein